VAPPDRPVAVSTPPNFADLAADPGELVASCQRCHHDAVLPVAPVLARYGPTTPFPEVKGRFRCSAELVAALARPGHPTYRPMA
jgi:hypothetical protein